NFVQNIDGQKIVYNNEKTIEILKKSNSCYSSQFDADDTCISFMEKCVLNDNPAQIEECLRALNLSDNITERIKQNVSKMYPPIALNILHNFGFKMEEVYDPIC